MNTTPQQEQFLQYLNGNWLYKKDNIEYKQYLSDTDCTLQIFKDGIRTMLDEFSHQSIWDGDILIFRTSKTYYFVKDADENKLIFGEREKMMNEYEPKWEHIFTRVNF